MGRIRTIKPEFFLHEGLFDLEDEVGLPVRIAFAGLWTQSDREGRFKWRPRQLKTQILPYDDVDFSRVLDALMTRGFIEKYVVDGAEYGCVPGFLDHQVINNREKESSLPEPNENNSLTRGARVDDATGTRQVHAQVEGKGKEGNGKDTNPSSEADASDQQVADPPDPPKPKHTPEDHRLAEWMADHVLRVAPKSKPPKLDSWADTIRLMREIDKHTHREIAEVFTFANNDHFWSTNILSPSKLREKFGELDAKMRRTTNENTGRSTDTDPNARGISGAERTRRAREQLRQQEAQRCA